MLSYRPGETLLHRLDARSKLAFQLGFAVAIFSQGPLGVAVLSVLALGWLAVARLSPLTVAHAFRYPIVLLAFTPLVAGVRFAPLRLAAEPTLTAAFASVRILPVFAVSAAYVRTTTIRNSRAAVQWAIPGRLGTLFGVGVGLTVRLLPLLRRELLDAREAIRMRLGERRGTVTRARLLAHVGLRRVGGLSGRLSLGLRARCFAWNPTLPALAFSRWDVPVLVLATGLALSVFL